MYKHFFKRIIDCILSLLGLIVLSPFFLIIAIAIKLDDHGPVFYKQRRVGIHKTYFNLYKFRSMKEGTPEVATHLLKNPKQHTSRVGGFLRTFGLDELPQLLNILTGKMSIIGPRPALWNQDDLVAERDKYGANDIKPGLTGWAQINGRDRLDIVEKSRLDGEYVQKVNFWFDVKCFFGTIVSVLRKEGLPDDTDDTDDEEAVTDDQPTEHTEGE
jgi:O-antigen biosynthesis protein WbqP